jgi:hypothetical protein
LGWATDGVFANGTDIELTNVWNVIAFYEHVWSPQWKTSFFGGYVQVDYSDRAKDIINAGFIDFGEPVGSFERNPCNAPFAFAPIVGDPTLRNIIPLVGNSCDPSFSFWQVGTRTQWNPVAQLDIGLELLYTRFNTAFAGPAVVGVPDPQPDVFEIEDQDVWSVFFRFQRNFFP